jgi:hypothetical protein
MMSVQSLRQLSNGNSLMLLLLALMLVQCKTTKHTTKTTTRPDVERPVSRLNVDTIQWSAPDDSEVVVIDPSDVSDAEDLQSGAMADHKLAVILPLKTESMTFYSDQISSRDEALIQYYIGLKLGLKEIETRGLSLDVVIKDSHEDIGYLDQVLDDLNRRNVKYIFGGRGRAEVEKIAEYAKKENAMYISGWQANSKFIGENKQYIQLNPGFQSHALAILHDALSEFNPEQITLFGSRKEESRIGEINRLYQEMTGATDLLETFIVEDIEELEQLEMIEWTENPNKQVFIVPITRDFNLIHDFFRFLDFNELHEKSIVYGITEWNSDKLYSHLNNFDVRLSSFWNPGIAQNHSPFEESFYTMTGTLPGEKAYEGYGHILLIGELIKEMNNSKDLSDLNLEAPGMRALFVDHNTLESPGLDRLIQPSYLENKSVHMLGFRDFKYFVRPQ